MDAEFSSDLESPERDSVAEVALELVDASLALSFEVQMFLAGCSFFVSLVMVVAVTLLLAPHSILEEQRPEMVVLWNRPQQLVRPHC